MPACRECAFWRCRSIVVRFESVTDGTGPLRMFGKTGAPAWVGDNETPVWRRLSRSVVLPADRSALATARSGTRSKYSPALARTTVRRDSPGDQTTPIRGDRLSLSV